MVHKAVFLQEEKTFDSVHFNGTGTYKDLQKCLFVYLFQPQYIKKNT